MERTKKKSMDDSETFTERQILIGLITNTEYIKQIRDVWDIKLLESVTAKRMATWCIEYFDTYKVAPGREIENIYHKKVREGKMPKDVAEEIEQDILPSLSKEYERGELSPSLLDDTRNYFRERHLKIHEDTISGLIAAGQLDEAEKLIKEFQPLDILPTNKIDDYVWSVEDIRAHDREEPLLLMKPWLRAGEHTFIYGEAGTGKSLLAMSMAYLLGLREYDEACHQIGEWQVKNTTGCFYIDGEMGELACEERLSKFEWLGEQRSDKKIKFLTIPEYQLGTEDTFSLAERKNQLVILDWLKRHPKYKLLILDSVTTLFRLEEENSNSEWSNKVNPFLRDLRALGVACIILHHSGKDSGRGLRGASAMSAMAHNIFELKNHPDKDIDEGEAWFTISRKKQRAGGFEFKKFTLHYYQNSDFTGTEWETEESGKKKEEVLSDKEFACMSRVFAMKDRRETQQDIADYFGVTRQYITGLKAKCRRHGIIASDGTPTLLWAEIKKRFINSGFDVEDEE